MKSPNFDHRTPGTAVDMLVLHYTGMANVEAAVARLCDPVAKVSSHYVIDEGGNVYHLVAEHCRAWHAGKASWRRQDDVNDRSLGIELVNPGHEFGYRSFPEVQMLALEKLALAILARHPIEPRNVVGHSDVAPMRKMDPGELFNWRRLAGAGIGLWPDDAEIVDDTPDNIADMLTTYGYDTVDLEMTIKAFQRHFRPIKIDGVGDVEIVKLLTALVNGLT